MKRAEDATMKLSDVNDLDFSNAGAWPPAFKAIAVVLVIAAVGAAGYWFDTKDLWAEYERVQREEQNLRRQFENKQKVMANIDAYREQLEELRGMLDEMLQQLPTETEMPDLLEDVSRIGVENGLAFELFRPESEFSEGGVFISKPIAIRARASFHQFASFISDVSALDRIVTLESVEIRTEGERGSQPGQQDEDDLIIEATLQTYRYPEDLGEEDEG
jgi:type IV pilus assembly protein PilO